MKVLPHQPADLSAADSALAGLADLAAMQEAVDRVREARTRQAERVSASRSILDEHRAALEAAERVHQAEVAALEHVDRALAGHELRIAEVRERRRSDRAAQERTERRAEQDRQRLIEDGLAQLGRRASQGPQSG